MVPPRIICSECGSVVWIQLTDDTNGDYYCEVGHALAANDMYEGWLTEPDKIVVDENEKITAAA
jgi:hypothetical protein